VLLAELEARFRWGVLLISDSMSDETIPSWSAADDQVTAAITALVMRVIHADEAEAKVRIWDDPRDAQGTLVFDGQIEVPSGIVRMSDATGDILKEISTTPGRHQIQIFADSLVEARMVHVVIATVMP
jgi:hypothetical protein